MESKGEKLKLLNRLERKFGRYAIYNLMYYIIILSVLGIVISYINPSFIQYLTLNPEEILKGQVWRLVSWIIVSNASATGSNLIFLAIELYLYYYIGKNLEQAWGAFRFNLYYFTGIFMNVLVAFILYAFTKNGIDVGQYWSSLGLQYVNRSLFLAFATLYPDMQLLFMFVIPLKIKYLAYFYLAQVAYEIFGHITRGAFGFAVLILTALGNFFIFYFATRNYKKFSPQERKRRNRYQKQIHLVKGSTRHKCTVCGKTELDGDDLEFRFCSKCDGNYEYCMEHLFTHEHIKNKNTNL